jgi:signal transduction histidine kinase
VSKTHEESETATLEVTELSELLVSLLGHDLRNPLSAVAGLTQLLLRTEGMPPEAIRRIGAIDSAVLRMNQLVAKVLDFVACRSGAELELAPTVVDLRDLCVRALAAEQRARSDQPVELDVTEGATGRWDPVRLGQAIGYLLSFSLSRRSENAVRVAAHVYEEVVVLELRDDGASLREEECVRLFEPLTPPSEEPESVGRGLAIGLYLADRIVRGHGGSIAVSSPAAGGLAFSVLLPRDPRHLSENRRP